MWSALPDLFTWWAKPRKRLKRVRSGKREKLMQLPLFTLDFCRPYTICFTTCHNSAPVAQGIGRQPPELKIAGSNPAGRTKNYINKL